MKRYQKLSPSGQSGRHGIYDSRTGLVHAPYVNLLGMQMRDLTIFQLDEGDIKSRDLHWETPDFTNWGAEIREAVISLKKECRKLSHLKNRHKPKVSSKISKHILLA